MEHHETDGQRLCRLRKRAGLTQAQLGDRLGHTQGWVSRIERDVLVIDSIELLNRAARVLNVHPNELIGRPYRSASLSEERGHAAIGEIRRVVARYDLTPDWDRPVRDHGELRAAVTGLTALRRQALYAQLGETAPAIIRELHAAIECAHGEHAKEQLFGLLSLAYRETDSVAHALGYDDLSTLTGERVRWSAARCGDPLLVAVGEYLRVRDLWANALWADALVLMDRTIDDLSAGCRAGDPDTLSVAGSIQLRAAITSARAIDGDRAWDRLAEARDTSRRLHAVPDLPAVFDPYELTFTPTNVDMYEVGIAVELRDGARAVDAGAHTLIPAGTPPSRSGHFYLDLARGWIYHGDYAQALKSMERAEATAPMLVRNHSMAHNAVRAMVNHHRTANHGERIRGLANRMHVL